MSEVNPEQVVDEAITQVETLAAQYRNSISLKVDRKKLMALVAEVKRHRVDKAVPISAMSPEQLLNAYAKQSGAANGALVRFLSVLAVHTQQLTDMVLEIRDRDAKKEGSEEAEIKGNDVGADPEECARAVPEGGVGESERTPERHALRSESAH